MNGSPPGFPRLSSWWLRHCVSAPLHLDQNGVAVVGHIPRAIPHLAIPSVSLHDIGLMATGAFGVALVVFAESYSISARFAATHGYEVDADHELLAMGVANLGAGLFQGFAVQAAPPGRRRPTGPEARPHWPR